ASYPIAAGDCNGDGRIDGEDIAAFVGLLIEGPAAAGLSCAADLTGDDDVTPADHAAFVTLLLGG
ncbi:MAG: dockerin type I domain-containing protein, partial [Phycisphaerae bacterium]|nr:dockerin type I domain-containing protein [Phycisphaerae bacterium]